MGPPHGGSWVLLPCINNMILSRLYPLSLHHPPTSFMREGVEHERRDGCCMTIGNSIQGRNFQRRLSMLRGKILKRDTQSCCCILTMLSRGKFLARFCKLLPEVKESESEDAVYAQLDDEQWLMDLTFLTELTGILNALNLELL